MSLSKVFFLSSEIEPFSSSCSISSFSQLFGAQIKKNKEVDIRMCQPKYGYISERKYVLREVIRLKNLEIDFAPKNRVTNLKSAFIPHSRVQVYFMEDEEFFQPVPELLYKSRNGRIFSNNHLKFAYFAKSILVALKKLYWPPEVVVSNDWQMSYVPIVGRKIFKNDDFYKGIKYIYILHSYDNMKKVDKDVFKSLNLQSKDFELNDNHLNAIRNSDFTIILNDIKNPIVKKIQKNKKLNSELAALKKKHKIYDIDYSSDDINEKIDKIVEDGRNL